LTLAIGSNLTAQTPSQHDLTAERMKVIESVSNRPQVRGMDGERANITLRSVSFRGTGSTVQFLVEGVPVYSIITMPVDLDGMTLQRSSLGVHAIHVSSEAQNPRDMNLLEDYALQCLRREAGMQAAFRF
jgi:hypothetical protein